MKLDLGPFIPERIEQWAYWICEREAMRKRKAAGGRYPYSTDPVMADTRWCNVRRMDDKVSMWLMDNWYSSLSGRTQPKDLVAAALAARMINRTDTLEHITAGKNKTCSYPGWNYEYYRKRMYEVKATGEPVFTNAYIINGASGGPKIEQVLNAIDKCYDTKPFHFYDKYSMQNTAKHLHSLPGIGGFMAGQVVADLRWVVDYEGLWADKDEWAPPGPGSSRGMKYLLGLSSPDDMAGRGKDQSERQFLQTLPLLIDVARKHPKVGPIFRERGLEAHDIQNTLCELGKYIRVKNGGHAKNNYPPRS